MKPYTFLLASIAVIVVFGRWVDHRIDATSAPKVQAVPPDACRDERDRMFKLADLAVVYADTMSRLRAENDSLRRLLK